jgi:hypothetical protein
VNAPRPASTRRAGASTSGPSTGGVEGSAVVLAVGGSVVLVVEVDGSGGELVDVVEGGSEVVEPGSIVEVGSGGS